MCRLIEFEVQMSLNALESLPSIQMGVELLQACEQHHPELIPRVIGKVCELARCVGELGALSPITALLRPDSFNGAGAHRYAAAGILLGTIEGYEAGLPFVQQGVDLAEQSNDKTALVLALFDRGVVRTFAGMSTRAAEDFERVLQLLEDTGSVDLGMTTMSNLSCAYMDQNRLEAAEEVARNALAAASPRTKAFALANLALVAYRRNDIEGTRKYLEMMQGSTVRDSHKWIPAAVLALTGNCLAVERNWDEVVRYGNELIELSPTDEFPTDLSTVHGLIAHVLAITDSPARAVAYLLEKSAAIGRFDWIAAARLAVLAAEYALPTDVERARAIVTPILERATENGAIAVACEARAVLARVVNGGVDPLIASALTYAQQQRARRDNSGLAPSA
jgi:tetratricopeptide (TPR) repeat protein